MEFPMDLNALLERIQGGETRAAIAKELGIRVSSLDQRFRRKGFTWDPVSRQYIETSEVGQIYVRDGVVLPPRIVQVLTQMGKVKADPRQIASRLGYKSELQMAQDMMANGFKWSTEDANYIPTGLTDHAGVLLPQMEVEEESSHTPLPISTEEFPRIPRIRLSSPRLPKTVSFALSLHQLLQQYSREYNIRQSEVVEIAMVEFFQRYGYKRHVETILSDT